MKIVIATHNKDKCKEILKECKGLNAIFLTLDKFPQIGDIEETGTTLDENAFIKARTVHSITGLSAIADDTGLEVGALNGAPGIYSARFAGKHCSYRDNIDKLLRSMVGVPDNLRDAQFKTVMVYVDKNVELAVEGVVKGTITKKIKGLAGFGYDPIFYVHDAGKTFAEMKIKEKNLVSHRSRAIKALKADLATYLNASNIKENA